MIVVLNSLKRNNRSNDGTMEILKEVAPKECADWVWEARGQSALKAKYAIQFMIGEHREDALQSLATQTATRICPVSGKRMFLLYRGGASGGNRIHERCERTSWTPVISAAHRQGYYEDIPGKVGCAWVIESMLVAGLAHYTYEKPQTQKVADAEQEWIVIHFGPIEIENVVDAKRPKDLK